MDSISPELASMLRGSGSERRVGENEEIFAGGDAAAALHIVLSGAVRMIHYLEPGKEVIIGEFRDGEMFAVPPVFDGGKYPATAIASADSTLLLIGRRDFLKILRESSKFSFAVIEWMCAMLREKTATIQNLATASPEHRVGIVLLKLAEKQGGPMPLRIAHLRQDIAKMAGLTTETTIRAIRKLADKQLITISHGKIILESLEPLERSLKD